MTQAKAKFATPVLRSLAVLLTAGLLLTGLTGSASAGGDGKGTGGDGNGAGAHRKCKKNPNGKDKTTANKKAKCKKRKRKPGQKTPPATPVAPPAAPPVTPPASPPAPPETPPVTPPATTSLAISPTSFDFGAVQHGGFGGCGADPDPNCPTQVFTVSNTGTVTSGVPTTSIVEIHNPEVGGPAAFAIATNTCTAALAPGSSCSITVKFAPNSNAGDQTYSSRLDVTASPGSPVSSTLGGMAN
jgi:hypothetical protein